MRRAAASQAAADAIVAHQQRGRAPAFQPAPVTGNNAAAGLVAVIVAGDAMTPTFACGDLVVVDRAVDRISASGIYALVFDGEVTVRRVVRRSDGSVTITCDHPAYARWDEHFTRDTTKTLQVFGRLVWPRGA